MSRWGKWFGFARDEVFDEGMAAFDRADFEQAVEAFRDCLKECTGQEDVRLARFYMAQALSELGTERLRAGDASAALEHLQGALSLYPSYPAFNLAAARACRLLGDDSGQQQYLDRALASNPRYVDAQLFQGLCWYESGRHDEGLQRFCEACGRAGSLQDPRVQEALASHARGDVTTVVRYLQAVALRGGTEGNLHAKLGDSFMRARRFSDAIREYQFAIEACPQDANNHCRLARAYVAVEQYEAAKASLEDCLRYDGSHADAHAQLGVVYKVLRRNSDASLEFDRALRLNPDHPVALRFAGRTA